MGLGVMFVGIMLQGWDATYTSKCQLEWSSEGLRAEEEQLLLLECAQELLKRGYAKLELDENYGQAMQA
jgi:hypothetical protein